MSAAVRSNGGCEVMSPPAIFSGYHTHRACFLFSAIERVEAGLGKPA